MSRLGAIFSEVALYRLRSRKISLLIVLVSGVCPFRQRLSVVCLCFPEDLLSRIQSKYLCVCNQDVCSLPRAVVDHVHIFFSLCRFKTFKFRIPYFCLSKSFWVAILGPCKLPWTCDMSDIIMLNMYKRIKYSCGCMSCGACHATLSQFIKCQHCINHVEISTIFLLTRFAIAFPWFCVQSSEETDSFQSAHILFSSWKLCVPLYTKTGVKWKFQGHIPQKVVYSRVYSTWLGLFASMGTIYTHI